MRASISQVVWEWQVRDRIQNTGHTNATHNVNQRQAVRDGVDAAAGPTGGRDRNGQALIQNPSHHPRPGFLLLLLHPVSAAAEFRTVACPSVVLERGSLPAGRRLPRLISRKRLASKSSHEGPSRLRRGA